MVIDLKFCRFEDANWGFRLIGGADFEMPLTVVKITEGSIAEQCGMKVGDIIVRINETPTIDLSHNDAHKIILHSGNNFFLGVQRQDEKQNSPDINENGQICEEISNIQEDVEAANEEAAKSEGCIKEDETKSIAIETVEEEQLQKSVSEDEIAEMMSGEAEVLKEHNVIGVNFNRIFPKAEICQNSEVFRQLNEEAVKTKTEMEKDKRKWTTFLQKPNRPIPKSRKQLEEEAVQAYKVQIIKQPKPKVAPDHIPTPPPSPTLEIPPAIVEDVVVEEPMELPTDSEVPNLEPILDNDEHTNSEETQEGTEIEEHIESALEPEIYEEIIEKDIPLEISEPPKSDEELALERQLAQVQQQLLALSTLPSTIQATLDSVTKQLTELLPSFRLQSLPTQSEIVPIKDTTPEMESEKNLAEEHEIEQDNAATLCNRTEESCDDPVNEEYPVNTEPNGITGYQISENSINEDQTDYEYVKTTNSEDQPEIEEELHYKKQKKFIDEKQLQRVIKERAPKKTLTPQERPLILPGGRKWRKPKDAFNDQFIAEIISSQAELIVGTTLGVNFLKYQKPEKRIDLDKSEVYKVLHNLDKLPKRGIEVRPEKVLAEADVKNRATPIFCG